MRSTEVADEALVIATRAAADGTPSYQLVGEYRRLRARAYADQEAADMPPEPVLPPADHTHPLVILPYTEVNEETRAAVAGNTDPRYVEMVKLERTESYWELWDRLWRGARDFIIVEHDIVIHEEVLPQFRACREPWCTFGYPYAFGPAPYHGTGCVRFRAEMMEAVPDLIEAVGRRSGTHHPPRHWCSIDGFMQTELWARGYHGHQHHPPVGHLSTTCSHDCLGTF